MTPSRPSKTVMNPPPNDAATWLETVEGMAAHLESALGGGDSRVVVAALNEIIRSRTMNQIVEDSGLSRDSVAKVFSGEDGPASEPFSKVVQVLGIDLGVGRIR